MIVHGRIKKKYRDALEYFAKSTFSPQMHRHLQVRIAFKNNLGFYHGLVYVDDYNSKNKPRSFVIEINRRDPEEEVLKTLAHEVVHIRQFAYGELNEEMTHWKGKKLTWKQMNYLEQPWEKEASRLGELMYYFYIENLNDK